MVMYTAHSGESLGQFLQRAGYGDIEHVPKKNKPILIANCLTARIEIPGYDSLDSEWKESKKKSGEIGEVAQPVTALVRWLKNRSAEKKKERAEAARSKSGSGKAPGVKGGRVSKR